MNVVSLSLCYPSDRDPQAGLFIQRRLAALSASIPLRVIHPIPTPPWIRRRGYPPEEQRLPPVWHVPMHHLPGLSGPLNARLYARAVEPLLVGWMRQGDVDLLDAHFSWPDGVAASLLAARLKRPYVITLRGVLQRYVRHAAKRAAIVRALKGAAAVIAVSDDLRRQARALGIPDHRLHLIPNGVDTTIFKPADQRSARKELHLPESMKLLITVGHLCPRKGFHRVLDVLPKLLRHHPTLHYAIVGGDGAEQPFAQRLRRLAHRGGLADRVLFTGALPPPDVARWLAAADLFVLPTTNEGCCNALLEARAAGLPVVCTDVGGNREWVTVSSGLLVPPNDHRQLHDAVNTMLRTRPHRRAIAAAPTLRTWNRVAHETASVWRNALRQRTSPAE